MDTQRLKGWYARAAEAGFLFLRIRQGDNFPPPKGWNKLDKDGRVRETADASVHADVALSWLRSGDNVGVGCGPGTCIVDLDGADYGLQNEDGIDVGLEELMARDIDDQIYEAHKDDAERWVGDNFDAPYTCLRTHTPRGQQYLFSGPRAGALRQTQDALPHVDTRGALKGYGMGPGSVRDLASYSKRDKDGNLVKPPPDDSGGPWTYDAWVGTEKIEYVCDIPQATVDRLFPAKPEPDPEQSKPKAGTRRTRHTKPLDELAKATSGHIHTRLVAALTSALAVKADPETVWTVYEQVSTDADPRGKFERVLRDQAKFVEDNPTKPKKCGNFPIFGGRVRGSVADVVAEVVARDVESVEARIAHGIDQWIDDCTEHDETRRQVLRAQLRHDARIEEEAPDASGYDPIEPAAMRSTGDYRAALDKVRFARPGKGLATLLKEGVKALMHGATTDEVALAATGGDVKAYPEATLPQWLSDLDYAFVDVLARTNAERGAKAVSGALRGVLAKIKEAARKEHAADVEREQKRARYAGQPTPYADLSEATFTDALEKLGAAIRFNEIAHHAELSRDGGETWKHMDPELESRLQIDIENEFLFWAGKRTEALHWPEVKWARLVKAQFALAENRFHPIRAWLEGLRGRWDGTARLDGWLAECFIPAKQADPILQWAARYILMAVVRRSFYPGAKADEMPILKGAAGSGKSTALKYLLPPILHLAGFSDALSFQESSPAKWAELLEKASIVEAEECIGITQAKINAVKQFVGSTNDDRTDKWEKRKSLKPRNCIIVGTINAERDLPLDPSNRKMIVAELDLRRHARSAVGPIEEWFEQEVAPGLTRRDALWAEALHRVEAGESFAFPSELLDHLQERMAAHTDGGSFAEDIEALPSRKPNGLRWSFDDVLVELFGDMENRPYYPADAPGDTRRPIPYDPMETPPATCKAVSETMRRCGFVKMVFRGYMTEQDGTAHRPKITRYGRPEYETQALERLCADVHRAIGSLTRTDVPDGLTLENIVERAKVAKCRPMLFVSEMSRELFEAVRRCGWIRYSTLDGRYTDGPRRFWPKR